MKARTSIVLTVSVCALIGWPVLAWAAPMGTAFTYQGQLKQGGVPVTGSADLEFTLWHDPNAADPNSQAGPTLTMSNLDVDIGLFTVTLDFGGVFDGQARPIRTTTMWRVCPAAAGS